MRLGNLPMSSGQTGKNLIQSIELQRLQIDLKNQLIKTDSNRETIQFFIEFPQTNHRTLFKRTNSGYILLQLITNDLIFIVREETKYPKFGSKAESEFNLNPYLSSGQIRCN